MNTGYESKEKDSQGEQIEQNKIELNESEPDPYDDKASSSSDENSIQEDENNQINENQSEARKKLKK